MVLGNLPLNLRSKVDNIQLAMLCYKKYILTFFSWEKIMKRLINNLKRLENEGIDISVGNETINFVGTVVAMLEDNLGSHLPFEVEGRPKSSSSVDTSTLSLVELLSQSGLQVPGTGTNSSNSTYSKTHCQKYKLEQMRQEYNPTR